VEVLEPREEQLKRFLLQHHSRVQKYHLAALWPVIHESQASAKTRIEWLMLKTIDEAGGNPPLDDKTRAIRDVRVWMANLPDSRHLRFQAFCHAVGVDEEDPEPLLAQLRSKLMELRQVNYKKADLFLRDVVIHLGPGIFEDLDEGALAPHLQIPVDTVHRQVFGLFHDRESVKNVSDAHIRNWATRLFPEKPIQMDDLWFWGHFSLFTQKTEKRNQAKGVDSKIPIYRVLERKRPNSAMIETDRTLCLFLPDQAECMASLANEFISIVLGEDRCSAKILTKPAPKTNAKSSVSPDEMADRVK
jgi:hypothetical protein